ncbi:MAG: CoA transferase [Saprospiraceae bacterium]|jgi:crotonobetainyl-CoA:carnitine CoA-transferase CaiB-like acyl-CoA transferase|nr:CoA transferase [Saprospiraceae bacterium]
MTDTFFSGLRVVEFASVLAGPAVGMFFAELGAEVVKIENKTTGGDVTRGWKLPSENPESDRSAYFCSVNWGKTHLLLDLTKPADLQQALDLCDRADVVVSNFKPSAARRMGVDAAALHTRNPRLIHAQVCAWADPEDESPAFDVVLQAEAGFLFMCGEPDGPPVKMPVALIDLIAAHQLKEAILLALLRRERTGQGACVSVSLLESALASLANQATNWLMAGHIPQRMGTRHPNIAPYGDIFACADGRQILLAVGTERQFRQLCGCLGLAHLPDNPDFENNRARVQHRAALNTVLQEAFLKKDRSAWLAELRAQQVPAAQIRDMAAVFDMPEAQAMVLREGATRRMRTVAFKIDCTPEDAE